jgi:DNA mismatch endonuclease, patch repair protein
MTTKRRHKTKVRAKVRRRRMNLAPSGIEMIVRRTLRQLGIKWRGGQCVRGFYPDLYLPEYNALVEVNGCYWHGCKRCYPKSRRKAQMLRDRQKLACYLELGYQVIVLWEHDIRVDPVQAILAKVTI